ncbi:MAG: glycoside hydrolase 100 family protein [Balneolaceae bacterium]|nr:glycoside hydrolase 100 family protein [Balneolaceae bacterium]
MEPNTLEQRALELLHDACSPHGILASPEARDNYRRIWSRDAIIAGIAGLLTGDRKLLDGFRRSLLTLAAWQHPLGMIPSNVLPADAAEEAEEPPEVSYGTLAGRIDATCWFVVGSCLYLIHRDDDELCGQLEPRLRKALNLLDRWEMNGKGLLYTPLGGNWADEYPVEGHTLYDNLLRVWGMQLFAHLFSDERLFQRGSWIKKKIAVNFWPLPENRDHPDIYHPRAFEEFAEKSISHLPCSIGPRGYNFYFDAAGHALALLLGLTTDDQNRAVADYTREIQSTLGRKLIPAFWPVITEEDPRWLDLKLNYRYSFKNKPHHFHNGGIWPVWMGWYGMGMRTIGMESVAEEMLEEWIGLADRGGEGTLFNEYIASDTFEPSGKERLSFSASGLLFLTSAVNDSFRSKLPVT